MANLQWILYKMGSLEKLYKMTPPRQIFSSGFLSYKTSICSQHRFSGFAYSNIWKTQSWHHR
jgi:hypothetical protein